MAASAVVMNDNLNKTGVVDCHTIVVGLDIQDSEQHIVNYFIHAILVEHLTHTRHLLQANGLQMLQKIKKIGVLAVENPICVYNKFLAHDVQH